MSETKARFPFVWLAFIVVYVWLFSRTSSPDAAFLYGAIVGINLALVALRVGKRRAAR